VKGFISRLKLTEIWGRDNIWLYASYKQIHPNFRDVIQVGGGAIVSRGSRIKTRLLQYRNGVTTAALYLVGSMPCSNDRLARVVIISEKNMTARLNEGCWNKIKG